MIYEVWHYMSIQYACWYDLNMSCSSWNELNAHAWCVMATGRIVGNRVGLTGTVKGLRSM